MKSFFAAVIALTLTAAFGAETYQQAMKTARQLRSKRQYTEAIAAYQRALKLAPNPYSKWSATFYIGLSQVQAKKFDEGIATLRKSLEIATSENTRGESQYYIGYYHWAAKKYPQAVEELKKVAGVFKNKENVLIYRANYLIARTYFIQKKYKEAYDLALTVTKTKTADVAFSAWNTCFDVAVRIKDKAKAKDALDNMTTYTTKSKHPYYRYQSLRQTYIYYTHADRNPEKALDAAKKIEADEKFSKGQKIIGIYYQAIVYRSMKKNDLAIAAWKKLENCGDKFFENAAKRSLKSLTKK